jgi:hypothetical protein
MPYADQNFWLYPVAFFAALAMSYGLCFMIERHSHQTIDEQYTDQGEPRD